MLCLFGAFQIGLKGFRKSNYGIAKIDDSKIPRLEIPVNFIHQSVADSFALNIITMEGITNPRDMRDHFHHNSPFIFSL
ncbi:MAG: hypothetical protein V1838_05910 [Patescibacteria group bacterium]